MNVTVNVPKGYSYVTGTKRSGFVIKDYQENESVWIPEGRTESEGYCEGFYVSRYEISKLNEEIFESKANKYPIVDISYEDALKISKKLNAKVMTNDQFDRIIAWILETGTKTRHQIYEDSSDWGNYKNSGPHRMVKTGYNPQWMCNNIDNLAGNLWTWTSTGNEQAKILRGGCCMLEGQYSPLARKCYSYLEGSRFYTGLRVVL